MTIPTMTPAEAQAAGYVQLTFPFRPETEDWQLARVLADAARAGMPVVLVWMRAPHKMGDWSGMAVWRWSPSAKNNGGCP